MGDIIAGKYEVRGLIGQGGIGTVLRAYHRGLDEEVAIKVLNAGALADDEMRTRFRREARAAAKITSDHIARVFDFGEMDGGVPFLVMELLEGQDLGRLVARRGALDAIEVARWLMQACEAIAEAHALGIVHRDIKPDNLFLSRRRDGSETAKVLDFGISKKVSQDGQGMTSTSSTLGSPLYMSPEQLISPKNVDHRTDIWSLGAAMYELLSGAPPFRAETLTALAMKVVNEPHESMSAHGQWIDPDIEKVVDQCMAKLPRNRYASVAELVADLAPFCPQQGEISLPRTAALSDAATRRSSGDLKLDETVPLVGPDSEPPARRETVAASVPLDRTPLDRPGADTVPWNDAPPDTLAFSAGPPSGAVDKPPARHTHAAFGVTDAPSSQGRSPWPALVASAAIVVIGPMLWLWISHESAPHPAAPSHELSASTSTAPAPAADVHTADASSTAPPTSSALPSSTPSAIPATVPRPRAWPRPQSWPRPTATASTTSSAKPAASNLYDNRD